MDDPLANTGPVVAASLLILFNAPGEFCLVPSSTNGVIGTVDCTANPQIWPIQQIGYSNTGSAPSCADELCPTTAVEESSWGGVKKLFR